jgi:putative transposase
LSSDIVAYEDLPVRNLVWNHHLAKSIHDAGWSLFTGWLDYYGKVFGKVVVAVPPQYTSQDCSQCSHRVKKTLSTRTHRCPRCGVVIDRDENAAINILRKGLELLGEEWNNGTLSKREPPRKGERLGRKAYGPLPR